MKDLKKDKDVTLWVSIVMALVLFFPVYGQMFTSCKSEKKVAVTHPQYDEATVHVCAGNIWDLFYQLQGCPAMMEEVQANPLLTELYDCADHKDCLTCAAVLMFKLWQESDIWADTLGESEPGETVPEDVVYVLHEQLLLDEYLMNK